MWDLNARNSGALARFKPLESIIDSHANIRPSLNVSSFCIFLFAPLLHLLPPCLILAVFSSYQPLPFLTLSDQLKLSERHLLFFYQSFIPAVDRGFLVSNQHPSFLVSSLASVYISLPWLMKFYFIRC